METHRGVTKHLKIDNSNLIIQKGATFDLIFKPASSCCQMFQACLCTGHAGLGLH